MSGGHRPRGGKRRMNKYELIIVLSAKLEDDERTKAMERVQKYVTRYGGVIESIDEWGKKKLAYEIQKMSEGFYYFIRFESEPSVPAQVEENIRLMEQVLRFLCISREE